MPEIDILDVGMGGKMLALLCWNLVCFLCFCVGKYVYFRKNCWEIYYFKEKCWKTFTESFSNPVIGGCFCDKFVTIAVTNLQNTTFLFCDKFFSL